MHRTSHRCPHCSQFLALSSDMWGLYYLCATCGWTCEDDDRIPEAQRSVASITQGILSAQTQERNKPHLRA
jgi:DNA-directed RNA polymerase subunit RPC12/RpoP